MADWEVCTNCIDGSVDCEECYGAGEYEDGTTCGFCAGLGTETCDVCGGFAGWYNEGEHDDA